MNVNFLERKNTKKLLFSRRRRVRCPEEVHGARLDLEGPIGGSPRSLGRDFLQKWSVAG